MAGLVELETPSCPLCARAECAVAYGGFDPFRVVQCRGCGFYYLSPRLTERAMIERYRDDAYFGGGGEGYASYAGQERSLRRTFRRLMSTLRKRALTGGSLLDVGCGYGYLLEEAAPYLDLRVGTEFSSQGAGEARARADRVYHGGIEQVPSGEIFDCIIAVQVIEHVYQPRTFVQALLAHLKPGGRIVIATPHAGSLWRRLMGHRWPSFKVPEHILYFDRRSLSMLMRQAGLTSITDLPYPHAFPLSLVTSKLGFAVPETMGKLNLWMPATTIALCGARSHG